MLIRRLDPQLPVRTRVVLEQQEEEEEEAQFSGEKLGRLRTQGRRVL